MPRQEQTVHRALKGVDERGYCKDKPETEKEPELAEVAFGERRVPDGAGRKCRRHEVGESGPGQQSKPAPPQFDRRETKSEGHDGPQHRAGDELPYLEARTHDLLAHFDQADAEREHDRATDLLPVAVRKRRYHEQQQWSAADRDPVGDERGSTKVALTTFRLQTHH